MNFVRNVLVLTAGVFLAALIVPGISFGENWEHMNALFLVALVMALFNAVVKPILVLFTLPFIFLSLGLGLWIINALLLYWASRIVPGFYVSSFWAALAGAFVISLTNMLLSGSGVMRARRAQRPPQNPQNPPKKGQDGEVIDI